MSAGIDAEVLASILASLDVGPHKAVSYLPLYTVRDFLKRDPCELAEEFRTRGLSAQIFSADECCIQSGALYAWDDAAVKHIVEKHWAYEVVVEDVVRQIASTWLDPNHVLMPLIRELFGQGFQART